MCIYQAATRAFCRSRLREQENITLPPKCCQHLTRPRVYPSTIPPHIEAWAFGATRSPPPFFLPLYTLLCDSPPTKDSRSCRSAKPASRLLPFCRACAIKRFQAALIFPVAAPFKHFSLFSSRAERAPISLFLHVWETMNWRYVMNRSPATSRFGRGIINSALAKYVTACSTKEVPQ